MFFCVQCCWGTRKTYEQNFIQKVLAGQRAMLYGGNFEKLGVLGRIRFTEAKIVAYIRLSEPILKVPSYKWLTDPLGRGSMAVFGVFLSQGDQGQL